jgi:hypothetical protein
MVQAMPGNRATQQIESSGDVALPLADQQQPADRRAIRMKANTARRPGLPAVITLRRGRGIGGSQTRHETFERRYHPRARTHTRGASVANDTYSKASVVRTTGTCAMRGRPPLCCAARTGLFAIDAPSVALLKWTLSSFSVRNAPSAATNSPSRSRAACTAAPTDAAAATLVDGRDADQEIERLLAKPGAAYLHVHFAAPGCYAARVGRA